MTDEPKSSDERKASDILLSIESKIDKILGYQQNNDLLYKLLLERIEKLSQQFGTQRKAPTVDAPAIPKQDLQQKQARAAQKIQQAEDKNAVQAIEPDLIFSEYNPTKVVSAPKSKLQKALEDADQDQALENEITVDRTPAGKKRNLRFYSDEQSKKVPVQQRVLYPDNKAVYMAKVEILDGDSNLVHQTRTNQVGKWLAVLKPGPYTVTIAKSASSMKPKVELTYEITVPDGDAPTVELDPQKV